MAYGNITTAWTGVVTPPIYNPWGYDKNVYSYQIQYQYRQEMAQGKTQIRATTMRLYNNNPWYYSISWYAVWKAKIYSGSKSGEWVASYGGNGSSGYTPSNARYNDIANTSGGFINIGYAAPYGNHNTHQDMSLDGEWLTLENGDLSDVNIEGSIICAPVNRQADQRNMLGLINWTYRSFGKLNIPKAGSKVGIEATYDLDENNNFTVVVTAKSETAGASLNNLTYTFVYYDSETGEEKSFVYKREGSLSIDIPFTKVFTELEENTIYTLTITADPSTGDGGDPLMYEFKTNSLEPYIYFKRENKIGNAEDNYISLNPILKTRGYWYGKKGGVIKAYKIKKAYFMKDGKLLELGKE